jgi:hypothetical protein
MYATVAYEVKQSIFRWDMETYYNRLYPLNVEGIPQSGQASKGSLAPMVHANNLAKDTIG